MPNATVKNQARVDGYVKIENVSENTWIELVDNNKLVFASENDTLIISNNINPKSVEIISNAKLVTNQEILVKAKKGVIILVKASEVDEGVKIEMKTEEEYENITLSNKVTQEEIDKEIYDRNKVKELIGRIELLENISLEDAQRVASMRETYDALGVDKKALITNLWKLEDAEAKIKELEVEKAEEERQAKIVKETLSKINSIKTLEQLRAIEVDKSLSEENKSKLEDAIKARKIDLEKEDINKEAAKAVENLISDLPKDITLGSKEAVKAASIAFDKLTAEQKELVDLGKITKLAEALEKLKELESSDKDERIAREVEEKISNLPEEITLESKEAVEAARKAYDSLTKGQKELVNNLDTLTAAEAEIEILEADKAKEEAEQVEVERQAKVVADTLAEINAAETLETLETIKIDESLSEANKKTLKEAKNKKKVELEKAKQKETDKLAAKVVENLISDLPKDITLESKEAVETARKAYDGLSEDQKELVNNLDTLTAAEAEIERLEADKAKEEIDKAKGKAISEVKEEYPEANYSKNKEEYNEAIGKIDEAKSIDEIEGKKAEAKVLISKLYIDSEVEEIEKIENHFNNHMKKTLNAANTVGKKAGVVQYDYNYETGYYHVMINKEKNSLGGVDLKGTSLATGLLNFLTTADKGHKNAHEQLVEVRVISLNAEDSSQSYNRDELNSASSSWLGAIRCINYFIPKGKPLKLGSTVGENFKMEYKYKLSTGKKYMRYGEVYFSNDYPL